MDPKRQASFPLERVDQVCVVVRDLESAMERYWKLLGIGPWRVYTYGPPLVKDLTCHGQPAHYRFRIALAQAGTLGYELVQPLDNDSPYAEFLERCGEGIQHLGVFVPSLAEAVAQAQAAGFEVTHSGRGYGVGGDGGFAYLDSDKTLGAIIELIEIPAERQPPEQIYPPPGAS